MFVLMILLFVVGYLIIAFEHALNVNKAATALLLGVLLWVCVIVGGELMFSGNISLKDYLMRDSGNNFISWVVNLKLVESLAEIAQIIFFLLGAMIIVELVDTQRGFQMITDRIKTTHKVKLLWIISIFAFFLSAVLDNMTTAIVMVALLRKLIADKKDKLFFGSMIIIAANAGGAWSPIGDVTTIMLWIGEKVTALNIIEMVFFASFTSLVVPLIILSFFMKGRVTRPAHTTYSNEDSIPQWQQTLFLILGVGGLLFVPLFKTITHLPPYLGMLGALAVIWIVSEIVHRKSDTAMKSKYSITHVLTKIEISTILFFLGILLAVSALQTAGHLEVLGARLDTIPLSEPSKYYAINIIIGLLSSIVDNVPLVAGAMGMYNFGCDHYFWEFLAYCAGTGGSILIIGSAAGVAVMGMEKIDFMWYLKKISWIALLGYFAGASVFIFQKFIFL